MDRDYRDDARSGVTRPKTAGGEDAPIDGPALRALARDVIDLRAVHGERMRPSGKGGQAARLTLGPQLIEG